MGGTRRCALAKGQDPVEWTLQGGQQRRTLWLKTLLISRDFSLTIILEDMSTILIGAFVSLKINK